MSAERGNDKKLKDDAYCPLPSNARFNLNTFTLGSPNISQWRCSMYRIGWAQVGTAGFPRVIGIGPRGRRPSPEVFAGAERLADQLRAERLALAIPHKAAVRLMGRKSARYLVKIVWRDVNKR